MDYKQLSELNVAIGVLARDCASPLEKNIPRVEAMGNLFNSYKVIVYENDSKDGTKEILRKWCEKNPNITVIMEDSKKDTIPQRSKNNPYPAKSRYRIEKMAGLRNRLLDEISVTAPDICIFLDIDLFWIAPITVKKTIENAPEDWGGLFGNGKVTRRYPDYIAERPMLYDSYAYVDKDVDPCAVGSWLYDKDFHFVMGARMYSKMKKKLYSSCTSAFNNIGIYKYEAIKGLRYEVVQTPELEPVNVAMCEHVPFNLKVVQRGYGNYIARDLVVYSECKDGRDYKKWYDRWKKKHETFHFFSKHYWVFFKMHYHEMLYALGIGPYQRRKRQGEW